MHGVQRAHSHASGDEHLNALVRQSLHGHDAAALIMTFIIFNGHVKNPTVLNACHGIGVSMTEMRAGTGVQTGGSVGGNSDKNSFGHKETPLIKTAGKLS